MKRMPHILPKQFIKILNIYNVMTAVLDSIERQGYLGVVSAVHRINNSKKVVFNAHGLTQCYNEQYCVFQWLPLFSETVQLYWAVRSTEQRREGKTKHLKQNVECKVSIVQRRDVFLSQVFNSSHLLNHVSPAHAINNSLWPDRSMRR